MDADAQAAIFERMQELVDIDEITPDFANSYMRNTSDSKTTWNENKNGHLVPRERDTKGFSQKKAAIAEKMGKIAGIYDKAADSSKVDKAQEEFDAFEYTLTQHNIDKMNERLGAGYEDRAGQANGNIGELRQTFDDAPKPARKYIVAQINNQLIYNSDSPIKQAYRDKDVGKLEQLKGDVRGLPLERDLVRMIDKYIDELKEQKNQ
jgi:hypothetical protein